MNDDFINYLYDTFPELFIKNKTKITCKDGWFRLIIWLSRYISNYMTLQINAATQYPTKYLKPDPIQFTYIYESNAILKFEYIGQNEYLKPIILFTEYISGFICSVCGQTNNVQFLIKNNIITKTLDNKCITKHINKNNNITCSVDDKKLKQILINNNFLF